MKQTFKDFFLLFDRFVALWSDLSRSRKHWCGYAVISWQSNHVTIFQWDAIELLDHNPLQILILYWSQLHSLKFSDCLAQLQFSHVDKLRQTYNKKNPQKWPSPLYMLNWSVHTKKITKSKLATVPAGKNVAHNLSRDLTQTGVMNFALNIRWNVKHGGEWRAICSKLEPDMLLILHCTSSCSAKAIVTEVILVFVVVVEDEFHSGV